MLISSIEVSVRSLQFQIKLNLIKLTHLHKISRLKNSGFYSMQVLWIHYCINLLGYECQNKLEKRSHPKWHLTLKEGIDEIGFKSKIIFGDGSSVKIYEYFLSTLFHVQDIIRCEKLPLKRRWIAYMLTKWLGFVESSFKENLLHWQHSRMV